ncbi:YceI family protein [Bizionia myxarmorum]|uniref:YceI family protein n=1 Tax=Bizionia myxarmorum TaxID=291186 RepID=A0A5D0REM3_9FLAO|nr:YceI family protein [Bizionia myxarmorum]TYB79381.1 YceI family protein [Bizionia myxarmorum]
MKNHLFSVICFLTLSTFTFSQTINSEKSVVDFNIKAGGIFNVNGTFTEMQGTFNFEEAAVENACFDICINAKTINTENNKRDTHLRSDDFFAIENYPSICYKSDSVSKLKDGFSTTGNLTIHGVTKTVIIPFSYKNNVFKGEIEINRFDYNIGDDYGSWRVGETASVIITCIIN